MSKKLSIIILSVLFIGCGTGLNSRWGNFTAYYNTYYNAKKSYQSGLKQVLDAKTNYNPQQPIHILEVPINAGTREFDKAIEKGAEILRKHGDTKWVDNSLLLIGKSYFFKSEFFSADQKFQELAVRTDDEKVIQESVLWRARVLLEMELYGQGIQYINEQLTDREGNWDPKKEAELQLILAEYHVVQENWNLAITALKDALPSVSSKKYKERGYFLLGQLQERVENYREAFRAYNMVQNFYADYDLQYLALRKTAETARFLGDSDTALATFKSMVRDDKNTEFKSELDYEIAKTHQQKEEYTTAESIYKSILQDVRLKPSNETKALSYYGLAEIYRYGFNDFKMAAAYYDTSSRQNASLEKLPETFDASELAISFGEYTRIKNQIHLKDSLLWVSELPKVELDSLIAKIKKQKLKELEEAKRNQEQQQNTLVNLNANPQNQENTGNNGFLNVNSPSMQQNARTQFIAIWGNRPLVDNWRVQELIQTAAASTITENSNGDIQQNQTSNFQSFNTGVDLSQVPFQEEQKEQMNAELATLNYELGNLFYISLGMPDSAAIYFTEVINSYPNSDEIPVSYYSLSEIQALNGDLELAKQTAKSLIDKYPSSRYAERLSVKYDIENNVDLKADEQTITQRFNDLQNDTTLSLVERAEMVTELALKNTDNIDAASILYEGIKLYMLLGKQDSLYKQQYTNWIKTHQKYNDDKKALADFKATVRESLNDTTLSETKRQNLQAQLDSTITEPDFRSIFPFYGESWESARININLFLVNFKNSPLVKKVTVLKNELEKPTEIVPESVDGTEVEIPAEESLVLSCFEIEPVPEVRGGIDSFLDNIPEIDSDIGEIVYTLTINQRGIVEDFKLKTELADDNVKEIFDTAITEDLTFEPIIVNGEAISVTCNYTFPLNK